MLTQRLPTFRWDGLPGASRRGAGHGTTQSDGRSSFYLNRVTATGGSY